MNDKDDARLALTVAIITQIIWGLLPLWAGLFPHTDAMQMLVYRVIFCALAATVFVFALKQSAALMDLVRSPKKWPPYILTAVLLGANWLAFFVAVQSGHVLEVSFGTYLLPLLSIAMGVVFLSEKLTPWTSAGLAAAALGVCAMSLSASGPPWIGIFLASTFSGYTILRKVYPIAPLVGLTFEGWVMALFAVGYLALLPGNQIFAAGDVSHIAWLISLGFQTTLTMVMFNYSTHRLRMTTTGMLQFMSPSIVFSIALLHGEPLSPIKGVGFALIWLGIVFYLIDAVRARAAHRAELAASIAALDVR